jgi:hypothetical protein
MEMMHSNTQMTQLGMWVRIQMETNSKCTLRAVTRDTAPGHLFHCDEGERGLFHNTLVQPDLWHLSRLHLLINKTVTKMLKIQNKTNNVPFQTPILGPNSKLYFVFSVIFPLALHKLKIPFILKNR